MVPLLSIKPSPFLFLVLLPVWAPGGSAWRPMRMCVESTEGIEYRWPSWPSCSCGWCRGSKGPKNNAKNNFRARSVMVLMMGGRDIQPLGSWDGGLPSLGLFRPNSTWHLHCHRCGWGVHPPANCPRKCSSVQLSVRVWELWVGVLLQSVGHRGAALFFSLHHYMLCT